MYERNTVLTSRPRWHCEVDPIGWTGIGMTRVLTEAGFTEEYGYLVPRLLPRFFVHIRDKLLQAHLRSGLNRVLRTE
jgi:hypothetical protein